MSRITKRLAIVTTLLAVVAGGPAAFGQTKTAPARTAAAKPSVAVYKTPTCGCCEKWIDHMRTHGFVVTATNMPDVSAIKSKNGVPERLQSCHTSLVGGYVIEGHVPAEDVQRLLKDRPAVVGLAAPGMPAGAPGMDVPGAPAYQVLTFDKAGNTTVFAAHTPK
jgi:hypothetical protein